MLTMTLFSGLGIDEFYLEEQGLNVIAACELLSRRANGYKQLHKNQNVFIGDITNFQLKQDLIDFALKNEVKCIIATPPCQGFSSIGKNRKKYDGDPRNYLVLHALDIVEAVLPDYFLIENVPQFLQMEYVMKGKRLKVEEYLKARLGKTYQIKVNVFDAQNFGVPQKRQRAVIRLFKNGLSWADPDQKPIITLRQAIGDLPSLMPGETSEIPNHFARKQPENQIIAMSHTPTGCSAFKNDFYFPKKSDGTRIKGFPNTYKRMKWDEPANALTMRNECLSSQDNVHPGRKLPDGTYSDPRVLTLREVLIVSSLPPDLSIPSNMTETQFRQVIGEGIPPRMLAEIVKGIGENK